MRTLSRVLLAAAAVPALAACGTYVEPKPGVYRGVGMAGDTTCIYEAPTNSVIASWRCRTNEAASRSAEAARETLDRTPTIMPRDP